MKKVILLLISVFIFSCADDSWKQELEDIRAELANQKQLIEALQQNATITGIELGNDQYTIKFSDGQSITLSNGRTPIITIGENGNWFINGTDTGKTSIGKDGQTPSVKIGDNGNWWINGEDTGVRAEGINGQDAPHITSIVNKNNNISFIFSDGSIIECPLKAMSNITGKTFWTIFDSLGSGNTWQNKYVELTGAIFYPELNSTTTHPISIGGTSSSASILNGTFNRAKNLVKYKNSYPIDIVFIENISDVNLNIGKEDDIPWVQGRKITCHNGAFASSIEATDYAKTHFNTI